MHGHRRALGFGAVVLAGGAAVALGSGVALAGTGGGATDTSSPPTSARVTICHATGSASAPYAVDTPSELAVLSNNYEPRSSRDIIPPFTLHGQTYAGRNWNSTDRAILQAGCVVATTPKVSVVSNASGTGAEVVPTGSTHAGEYDGGWTGGQWWGAALAVSGALTSAGALLRRRLAHRV